MPMAGNKGDRVSLYIHVPFCTRKCPYCHFYVLPNRSDLRTLFMHALLQEWNLKAPLLQGKEICSIYFGGGTPSLLGPSLLSEIMNSIRATDLPLTKECEITLEVNPEESSISFFTECLALGINRLSFGVQALDDQSLHLLGRAHHAMQAKEAIQSAALAGFTNISIDLMIDIPRQTTHSLCMTLAQLPALPIQHLSLYNLTIEANTPFARRKQALTPLLPTPEESLLLLETAIEQIEQMGLQRYEISAFGTPSQHNMGYWTGRPFLGLGPSAFSYWNGSRFQNMANLKTYHERILTEGHAVDFQERLPFPRNFQELLAIRLRLMQGACLEEIAALLHTSIPETAIHSLQKLMTQGWITYDPPYWKLTTQGKRFYDSVAETII